MPRAELAVSRLSDPSYQHRMSEAPGRESNGALAVVTAGLVWAALCAVLAADGRAPTVALLPIPHDRYYAAQALFVVPVLLGQWWLASQVSWRIARRLGGTGSWAGTLGPMGWALALPLLVFFLLPDLVVYLAAGFEGLGRIVRFTAPTSLFGAVVLATRVMRRVHGLGWGRAWAAGFAGVLAQAVLGGVFLR